MSHIKNESERVWVFAWALFLQGYAWAEISRKKSVRIKSLHNEG